MDEELQNRRVARRRLLRRAGTVAAGVAGAGAVGSMMAPSAAYAASAEFDSSAANVAAVKATNTFASSETINGTPVPTFGPQLQLVKSTNGELISNQAPVGSVGMDKDGFIWAVTGSGTGGTFRNFLYDTSNASQTWPVSPVRLLDTRGFGVGRSNLLGATSADLTPAGRLRPGRWIHLDCTDEVKFGYAIIGGISVALPSGGGHIAVVPYGSVDYSQSPGTSNILFNGGVYLQNNLFCGLGGGVGQISTDAISIWSTQETDVIIDAFGFIVDSPGRIAQFNTAAQAGVRGASGTGNALADRRAMIAAQAPKP